MATDTQILQDLSPNPARAPGPVNVGGTERAASGIGGVMLLLSALQRIPASSLMLLIAGGLLIYRGSSGRCPVYARLGIDTTRHAERGTELRATLTVDRSRAEVYAFWRDFENLPRFMRHLQSVTRTGQSIWHWVARAVGRTHAGWDAELVEERPEELIRWRSVPGSQILATGAVEFLDAPGDRGTELRVHLAYRPAPGGAKLARLLQPVTDQMLLEDLWRLKSLLESGAARTIQGRPLESDQPPAGPTAH